MPDEKECGDKADTQKKDGREADDVRAQQDASQNAPTVIAGSTPASVSEGKKPGVDEDAPTLKLGAPTGGAPAPPSLAAGHVSHALPSSSTLPTIGPDHVRWPATGQPAGVSGKPFGRYVLMGELGRGGMGVVYKAWDAQLQRTVALKTMLEKQGDTDRDMIKRFQREAQSAARLRHPHIVQIFDVGVQEGAYYFTMDYLEGQDLKKLLEPDTWPPTGGPSQKLPLRKKLEILREVALALEHAHQQGIVHRDLKPANIIVTADRGPVVTDFGLARDIKQAGKSGLTLSGQVMGTPSYMSPEQAQGKISRIGPQSDVYALGVILYEMVTGQLPFNSENMYELLRMVVEVEPAAPSKATRQIHRDVETICLKAMEKDPAKRYATAGELADDLRRFLDGEPISARRVTRLGRLWRMILKRKATVIPIAAAMLFAIGLAVQQGLEKLRGLTEFQKALKSAVEAEGAQNYKDALGNYERAGGFAPEDETIRLAIDRCKTAIEKQKEQLEARAREAGVKLGKKEEEDRERRKKAALRAKARVFFDRGREPVKSDPKSEEALKQFTKAIEEDPTYAEAYYERGRIRWSRLEYDEALADFAEAIRNDAQFVNAYRDRALVLAAMGKTQEALDEFEHIIELDPGSDAGHFAKGNVLQNRKKYADAIEEYTQALSLNPNLHWALNNRGVAKAESSDLDGAIDDYNEVIRNNPAFPDAYVNRGLALARKGELDAAIMDYTRALEVNPEFSQAHYNRANARRQKGDLDGAIADYSEAIRTNPFSAEAYNNRGIARAQKGDVEGAITDYVQAIRINPDFASAYLNRGNARKSKGDLAGALADYSQAIKIDPKSAESFMNRGATRCAQGDIKGGLSDYGMAIQIDPQSAEAYCLRGIAVAGQGKIDAAFADYDTAIALNPRYAVAYFSRGNAYANKGDIAGAIADYDRAIECDPQYVEAYNNRGLAHERKGEIEDAIADYDQAIAANPQFAAVYYNRGTARRKKGDLDGAIADYDEAAKLQPQNTNARVNRGSARCDKGDYDAAIADFNEVIAIDQRCAHAYANRGLARKLKGESAEAIADWEKALELAPKNWPFRKQVEKWLEEAKKEAGS